MQQHERRTLDKEGAPCRSSRAGVLRRTKGAESPHCRAQRLLRKRLYYARWRLRDLQKICPQVNEDLIATHGLHRISWSVRRAGKRTPQQCVLRSASAETAEAPEKQGDDNTARKRVSKSYSHNTDAQSIVNAHGIDDRTRRFATPEAAAPGAPEPDDLSERRR